MRLFRCRGCDARESEIEHLIYEIGELQKQVKNAVDRLAEIKSPGVNRRIVEATREPDSAPRRRIRFATLPGYEPQEMLAEHVPVEPDDGP